MYVDRRQDLDAGSSGSTSLPRGQVTGRSWPSRTPPGCTFAGGARCPEGVTASGVTGPISWGLTIVDQNQRSILYDEVLADAVGKHLQLSLAGA